MPVLVSLIIANYGRDRYLAEAIESVLAQTYPHFELLIWDDGSTDNSLPIAQSYAQRDPRIRVHAAPHQGVGSALKSAIAHTTASYLGWVDSDDRLAPTALEETIALLNAQPEVGMVYTQYEVIDAEGKAHGLGNRCYIPYSKDRLLTDFMTFHFRLIRRTAYQAAGGIDPTFPAAIDYDFCLRLSEVAPIYHHPYPLYAYRVHPHSISSQKRQQQIDWSAEAVRRALQRRRLDNRYELEVQPPSRFRIKPKLTRSILINGIGQPETLQAALITALILHHQTPDLPIVILTNKSSQPQWSSLPIQIQHIRFPEIWQNHESALLKTTLTHFTQTSQTLYLDPFLLPIASITEVWESLNHLDIGFATTASADGSLNSAVIFWQTLPETQALFTDWKEAWLTTKPEDPITVLQSSQHRDRISIFTLPNSYSYSVHPQDQLTALDRGQIKILQCHNLQNFQKCANFFWAESDQQIQSLLTQCAPCSQTG